MRHQSPGSLRWRLVLLFCSLAVLMGAVNFAAAQILVQRELANYANHVRQDQMSDWARVLSALYVEHGDSWSFAHTSGSRRGVFPIDGLVLGHAQYVIRSGTRVVAASPVDAAAVRVASPAGWSSIPITVGNERIGTLLVRSTASPALRLLSGQLSSSFAWLQAAFIALAVALSTVIAIQLLRRVLRPLEQLASAARGITQQAFDLPLPSAHDREVADVLQAFRAMRGYLTEAQEARARLLADVMHELRTPMTIVASQIEAVQLGVCAMTDEHLAVLYDEVTRMGTMLSDLQQLSDAQAGAVKLECAWVDVVGLLGGARDLFLLDCARRSIVCAIDARPDAVWMWLDRRRMTQVFVNLMSNAMRFTQDGGRIDWDVRPAPGSDASVRITIRDTGPGVAPEHLPHLFDRFYRADNSRCRDTGGSGLGLAIVREIVELHGGSVDVSSAAGEGAAFCVTLPVIPEGLLPPGEE